MGYHFSRTATSFNETNVEKDANCPFYIYNAGNCISALCIQSPISLYSYRLVWFSNIYTRSSMSL
jgi:hypothetical protein